MDPSPKRSRLEAYCYHHHKEAGMSASGKIATRGKNLVAMENERGKKNQSILLDVLSTSLYSPSYRGISILLRLYRPILSSPCCDA
jgi:hypothetical protein